MLTVTSHSYRKGQNSTLYKIETLERIEIKFGTINYVPDIVPQTKFGNNRISGASGGIHEIYELCDSFRQPTWGPLNRFSRKMA